MMSKKVLVTVVLAMVIGLLFAVPSLAGQEATYFVYKGCANGPAYTAAGMEGRLFMAWDSSGNMSYGVNEINDLGVSLSGSAVIRNSDSGWSTPDARQVTDDWWMQVTVQNPSSDTVEFIMTGWGDEEWQSVTHKSGYQSSITQIVSAAGGACSTADSDTITATQ